MALEPITRQEKIIAGQDLTPITRMEMFLKQYGGGGGGGGGSDGATFTPSVSADGTLSWTNNKGLTNPEPVNITGPQGLQGKAGPAGSDGQSAYAAAQAGGYTDTQANFYTDLAAVQGLASALAAI